MQQGQEHVSSAYEDYISDEEFFELESEGLSDDEREPPPINVGLSLLPAFSAKVHDRLFSAST